MKSTKAILAATLLLASAAAVTLPVMVQARGMGDMAGPAMMFDELDADKDGKVTEAEIAAFRANAAAGADANKDGQISLEELTAHETRMMAKMAAEHATRRMEAQDANGDGQLSIEEMLAPPAPPMLFAKLDKDGDGAVSKEEFDAARAMMAGREGRGGRGHGHGHGFGMPGMPGMDAPEQ